MLTLTDVFTQIGQTARKLPSVLSLKHKIQQELCCDGTAVDATYWKREKKNNKLSF